MLFKLFGTGSFILVNGRVALYRLLGVKGVNAPMLFICTYNPIALNLLYLLIHVCIKAKKRELRFRATV